MLAAEVHSNLPLFRHFPHIKDQLAWRELGDFPTPVHRASIRNGGVQFQVKREDLASPIYGGNKVRTLQHQLAVCESRLAAAAPGSAEHARLRRIAVVGSGGSNQVVASLAHAGPHLPKLEALWVAPDAPDLDNTLNMLSTLSLPNLGGYATSMGAAASTSTGTTRTAARRSCSRPRTASCPSSSSCSRSAAGRICTTASSRGAGTTR